MRKDKVAANKKNATPNEEEIKDEKRHFVRVRR